MKKKCKNMYVCTKMKREEDKEKENEENTEKDEEKKKMKKIKKREREEDTQKDLYLNRKERTIAAYLPRSCEVFYRNVISEVVPFFVAAVSQAKIDGRNLRIRNCPEFVDCASAR